MQNLNELELNVDEGDKRKFQDYGTNSEDGKTTVYFRDVESHLIKHIGEADYIVGCVAWLTSFPILNALSKKVGVSIIVQKEDFLRPDLDSSNRWKSDLRRAYDALPMSLNRQDHGFGSTVLYNMSVAYTPEIQPVRCIGNNNSAKSSAFPRAHHKFIVLCKDGLQLSERGARDQSSEWNSFNPYEVWTGSFNFTKNAGQSLENAVVMQDPKIVNAYFHEYAQIAAVSEPLDWERDWVAPEWRIGT